MTIIGIVLVIINPGGYFRQDSVCGCGLNCNCGMNGENCTCGPSCICDKGYSQASATTTTYTDSLVSPCYFGSYTNSTCNNNCCNGISTCTNMNDGTYSCMPTNLGTCSSSINNCLPGTTCVNNICTTAEAVPCFGNSDCNAVATSCENYGMNAACQVPQYIFDECSLMSGSGCNPSQYQVTDSAGNGKNYCCAIQYDPTTVGTNPTCSSGLMSKPLNGISSSSLPQVIIPSNSGLKICYNTA